MWPSHAPRQCTEALLHADKSAALTRNAQTAMEAGAGTQGSIRGSEVVMVDEMDERVKQAELGPVMVCT